MFNSDKHYAELYFQKDARSPLLLKLSLKIKNIFEQ